MSRRKQPWTWIPGVYATEGIVSATVNYVALLLLLQLGASFVKATLFVAALMLTSVIKWAFNWNQKRNSTLKTIIIALQALLFIAFVTTAFVIDSPNSKVNSIFICLLVIAVINAIYEKLNSLYYNNMLGKNEQKILGNYKFVSSQASFIITYGILIIFVGTHEVFFRNFHLAWSMEFYVVAGVILLLMAINALLLDTPKTKSEVIHNQIYHKSTNKKIIMRNIRFIAIIMAILLPQSLLFCTRVFYFMETVANGGLGCTLQEVGFIQGTIGIIAFIMGQFIGQKLLRAFGNKKLMWVIIFAMVISPFFYIILDMLQKPVSILNISTLTFASQITFGFGLNFCVIFIRRTTDVFDENILNLLHLPLVVIAMAPPIALSGFIMQFISFNNFFFLDAALAAFALIIVAINYNFIDRHIINYRIL